MLPDRRVEQPDPRVLDGLEGLERVDVAEEPLGGGDRGAAELPAAGGPGLERTGGAFQPAEAGDQVATVEQVAAFGVHDRARIGES